MKYLIPLFLILSACGSSSDGGDAGSSLPHPLNGTWKNTGRYCSGPYGREFCAPGLVPSTCPVGLNVNEVMIPLNGGGAMIDNQFYPMVNGVWIIRYRTEILVRFFGQIEREAIYNFAPGCEVLFEKQ